MAERILVTLQRSTVLTARPPTPEERKKWGPTWVNDAHLFGRHVGTWPADRYKFITR